MGARGTGQRSKMVTIHLRWRWLGYVKHSQMLYRTLDRQKKKKIQSNSVCVVISHFICSKTTSKKIRWHTASISFRFIVIIVNNNSCVNFYFKVHCLLKTCSTTENLCFWDLGRFENTKMIFLQILIHLRIISGQMKAGNDLSCLWIKASRFKDDIKRLILKLVKD